MKTYITYMQDDRQRLVRKKFYLEIFARAYMYYREKTGWKKVCIDMMD